MYNTVKLAEKEKDWCYQLYLWHDNLSVADDPYVNVIKTLIYGVKSSSNQAESGLRTTARIESGNFPRASTLIWGEFLGYDHTNDRQLTASSSSWRICSRRFCIFR